MANNICNHLHPWFKQASRRLTLLAFTALVCIAPVSAQTSGRTNSNSASAVLHISVFVVPTVMSPVKAAAVPSVNTVSYNVPTQKQMFTTTQEVRTYSVPGANGDNKNQSLLKTVTSVLR